MVVAVDGGSGGSGRDERGVGLGLGLGLGGSTATRSENAEEEMMLRTPTRPVATATGTTPVSVAASATSAASAAAASVASSSASMPGYARPGRPREVSTYEVLRYIRSAFDDEEVLDAVPLEAAGNPGAWHAWRTHRRQQQTAGTGKPLPVPGAGSASGSGSAVESGTRARINLGSAPSGTTGAEPEDQPGKAPTATAGVSASGTTRSGAGTQTGAETTTRRPNEWNWEGVWEERVKRGVAASLSEGVLFGHAGTADEVVRHCGFRRYVPSRRSPIPCVPVSRAAFSLHQLTVCVFADQLPQHGRRRDRRRKIQPTSDAWRRCMKEGGPVVTQPAGRKVLLAVGVGAKETRPRSRRGRAVPSGCAGSAANGGMHFPRLDNVSVFWTFLDSTLANETNRTWLRVLGAWTEMFEGSI